MAGKESFMIERRALHIAINHKGGVYAIGGLRSNEYLSKTERYEGSGWANAGDLITPRASASSVSLDDNGILITGGNGAEGTLKSCEIYSGGAWREVSPMLESRAEHRLLRLNDRELIAIGGRRFDGDLGIVLGSVEIYSVESDTWRATAQLKTPRMNHVAVQLVTGEVLVAGGYADGAALDSVEVFDPRTQTWAYIEPMNERRMGHAGSLDENGRVLVSGGWSQPFGPRIKSCERYDHQSGKWRDVARLNYARSFHESVFVPGINRVVVSGGNSRYDSTEQLLDRGQDGRQLFSNIRPEDMVFRSFPSLCVEVFNDAGWSDAAQLNAALVNHRAVCYGAGVLITGGSDPDIPDNNYSNLSSEIALA